MDPGRQALRLPHTVGCWEAKMSRTPSWGHRGGTVSQWQQGLGGAAGRENGQSGAMQSQVLRSPERPGQAPGPGPTGWHTCWPRLGREGAPASRQAPHQCLSVPPLPIPAQPDPPGGGLCPGPGGGRPLLMGTGPPQESEHGLSSRTLPTEDRLPTRVWVGLSPQGPCAGRLVLGRDGGL